MSTKEISWQCGSRPDFCTFPSLEKETGVAQWLTFDQVLTCQGTCQGCGLKPQQGACRRQLNDDSLFMFPSLPPTLLSVKIFFKGTVYYKKEMFLYTRHQASNCNVQRKRVKMHRLLQLPSFQISWLMQVAQDWKLDMT